MESQKEITKPESSPRASVPVTATTPGAPLSLPVPDLSSTLQRYLVSVAPLVSTDTFKATTIKCLKMLQDTAVPTGSSVISATRLQEMLQEKAAQCAAECKSWLIDDWVKLMYTTWRLPLPLNVSYWYLISDKVFRAVDRHVNVLNPVNCVRAAALVLQAARFRDLIYAKQIPNEVVDGIVLDKNMYRYIFHSCRMPRPVEDGVRVYDGGGPTAPLEAITVIRRGKLFLVSLHSKKSGYRVSLEELVERLSMVMSSPDASEPASPDIALLTGSHRDTWAAAYTQIFGETAILRPSHGVNVVADPEAELSAPSVLGARRNLQVLQAVESSLCAVCLDDNAPRTLSDKSRNLLDGNMSNRWWDKVVQFVVCDNGTAGFIGEHAFCDGMPTANMLAWACGRIARDVDDMPVDNSWIADMEAAIPADTRVIPSGATLVCPMPLVEIDGEHICDLLDVARKGAAAQRDHHECIPVNWASYGRDAIKKCGVSPDAWAQMAIQLAYFRWCGKIVPTYEPAQSRKFVWGRTACIRVVSDASCRWVAAMSVREKGQVVSRTPAGIHRLLKEAGDTHVCNSRLAAAGNDIDRHLLGLKILSDSLRRKDGSSPCSEAVHDFFADDALPASSTWMISTSNLSVDHFENWGWGEVVSNGVGIAYGVHPDGVTFNLVAERTLGISGLAEHLKLAMQEMYTIAAASKVATRAE